MFDRDKTLSFFRLAMDMSVESARRSLSKYNSSKVSENLVKSITSGVFLHLLNDKYNFLSFGKGAFRNSSVDL